MKVAKAQKASLTWDQAAQAPDQHCSSQVSGA